jgi:adenosylmethionine-8-amino-7-oxononanoate aminotransferase
MVDQLKKSNLLRSSLICPDWQRTFPKIVNGKGSVLIDEDGRRYIDGSGGASAATVLGHGNVEVADALHAQAILTPLLPTHYFDSNVLQEYLSELVAFAPPNIGYGWLASSGSDAIESAMKLAIQFQRSRGAPSRFKFIGRNHSYHGGTIASLDVGGIESRRVLYKSIFFGHEHGAAAHCTRCEFGLTRDVCNLECAEDIQHIIGRLDNSVAAVIVEPVVGAALGAVPAPRNYLRRLREITRGAGVLLILDEVMTGFGRTGANFAAMHDDIDADMIVCGKGMGGGYFPLSGILVSSEIGRHLEFNNEVFQGGHTHACNPLGAAVGKKVLQIILRDQLVSRSALLGKRALSILRAELHSDLVSDIRGKGLLFGLEFNPKIQLHRAAGYPAFSYCVASRALELGLISYPGLSALNGTGGHIKFAPPLNIDDVTFDQMLSIIVEAVRTFERRKSK